MGRPTDSGIIKEYCATNNGGVFDVGYISEKVFPEIPNANLRKIVQRLVESGVLKQYAKGIYLIGDSEIDDQERIVNFFLKEGELSTGMLTEQALFYSLGLTDDKPERITLRSNKTSTVRHIGNIYVEPTKTLFGSGGFHTYEICVVLDLIQNRQYVDVDKVQKYIEIRDKYASLYEDLTMRCLDLDYPRIIHVKLAELLESMDISNKAVEIYVEKSRLQHS